MFTIDIHTHILPEHIPDFKAKFGYEGFINLDHHKPCCARLMMDNEFFREVQDNCWSPEVRIKECDKHGVNVQVLSTLPVMFSYWAKPKDTLELAMFLNDHIFGEYLQKTKVLLQRSCLRHRKYFSFYILFQASLS